jgi:hypothetical protein
LGVVLLDGVKPRSSYLRRELTKSQSAMTASATSATMSQMLAWTTNLNTRASLDADH